LFFLAISCLAVAAAGSAVAYQRGERRRLAGGGQRPLSLPRGRRAEEPSSDSRPAASGQDEDEPTLQTLACGDVVVDGVDDWIVSGTVRYREEADTWALHVLDGGVRRRFLEVRARRGDVEVVVLDTAEDVPRGLLPGGLTFRGQVLRLDGRGDARTTSEGRLDGQASAGGVLQWARYSAAGGAVLLVEDEGARRRGFFGARVQPSSLSLMSGALNRADAASRDDDTSG
jgi:hypothetical protein